MLGCQWPEILSRHGKRSDTAGGRARRCRAWPGDPGNLLAPHEQVPGHGYVPAAHSAVGTQIGIEIRGRVKSAVIVKRPFYVPAYRR